MNMNENKTAWGSEGTRKLIVTLATIIGCVAVAITLIIVQPPGIDLAAWLTGLVGGSGGMGILFKVFNAFEHAIKANPPTLPSSTNVAKLGIVLVGLMLLVGCGGQTSYLPILQSSLTASQALTRGAQTQAVESGSLTACLASGALSDAFSSASDALDAWAQAEPDTYTLPGFKVDVSPCGSLSEGFKPLLREEAAAKVRSYTEGLAPLALTVTRAAVASAGMDCRDQLLVLAVLGYLEGALRPVVDELTSPDGVVEIPSVELNLARCG